MSTGYYLRVVILCFYFQRLANWAGSSSLRGLPRKRKLKLFNMRNVSLKTCGCFDVVHRVCTYVAVAILFVCLMASSANAQLVHPGGWHTQEDLTLIRERIAAGESPWRRAWIVARNEGPDANFTSNPPALITNVGAMHTAGMAAWVLTMKWVASGDRAFSDAAIGVIDNWVDRVRDFDVFAPSLTVSTGAGAMAQAAEILAHGFDGEAGWPAADVAAAQACLLYTSPSPRDKRQSRMPSSA